MKKERVRKGGRRLSYNIRNLIVNYKAAGLSTVKIQRKLQSTHQFVTSRQGIRNFINRFQKTGSVVDQRVNKTGQLQQVHIEFINMWMLRNPEETAESIRNRLETQHGVKISKEYVCAIRRKLNWTPSNVKYGQMISHKNVLHRLEWCIQEMIKQDTYEDVIYVDETTVEMSSSGRLFFYQPGSQLDRLPSKAPKPKHTYKVNVWGGISYRGRTDICIFTGIMDSIIYQKILEDNLLPFARRKFSGGFRLYQDNDSKHKSKSTQNWIKEQGLTESVMTTPASSPDLNPIENVWSALKGHLRCVVKPKTKDQLVTGIRSFWESLSAEQCGKYIDHVHRVIPQVILNRGGPTNF